MMSIREFLSIPVSVIVNAIVRQNEFFLTTTLRLSMTDSINTHATSWTSCLCRDFTIQPARIARFNMMWSFVREREHARFKWLGRSYEARQYDAELPTHDARHCRRHIRNKHARVPSSGQSKRLHINEWPLS